MPSKEQRILATRQSLQHKDLLRKDDQEERQINFGRSLCQLSPASKAILGSKAATEGSRDCHSEEEKVPEDLQR